MYDVDNKKAVGIFCSARYASIYVFDYPTIISTNAITVKRKWGTHKTPYKVVVTFRYANSEQIVLLGNEEYIILDSEFMIKEKDKKIQNSKRVGSGGIIPKVHKDTYKRDEEVKRLVQEGYTTKEIAKKLDMVLEGICRLTKDLNILDLPSIISRYTLEQLKQMQVLLGNRISRLENEKS